MMDTTVMLEGPPEVYGRLLEGAYTAGHSFERVCTHLEWLLQQDRWRKVGPGFDDVNAFLASIKLDSLRVSAEQRKRIATLIKELQPQASQRKIAGVLGVDHVTIGKDLARGDNSPSCPDKPSESRASGAVGGEKSPVLPRPAVPPTAGISGANAAKIALKKFRGTQGTGEAEWYTPIEIVTPARTVLGAIDLDPPSTDAANQIVKAKRIYTKQDDGLKQEWNGRVWLNPPYTHSEIVAFVSKMLTERKAGRVTTGIMLTHNYTDTVWFHDAASIADAICFTRGRVKFYKSNGEIAAPTQGQAIFYFGDAVDLFRREFESIGMVLPTRFGVVLLKVVEPPAP
jgi:phage N-6-adenine-methyltransferase